MKGRQAIPVIGGEIVISDRTYNASQSWYRERIVTKGDVRLRYSIRRNAYEEQSSAKVQVWSRDEWQGVHFIAGVEMKTIASYVDRAVKPSAFDADLAELRRVAFAILGIV